MEQPRRDARYFIDGRQERRLVGFGRFGKTTDFSNELKRSRLNFFGCHGRVKIKEGFDIPAHAFMSSMYQIEVEQAFSLCYFKSWWATASSELRNF
jgi:hypothetical protein